MTVQELFQRVKLEDFFAYYCKHFLDKSKTENELYEHCLKAKRKLKAVFHKMQTAEVIKSNNVVFSIPMFENGEFCFDSFYILEKDLEKENSKQCTKYSLILTDIKEILGYQVSDECLCAHGEVATAFGIFWEASFFGMPFSKKRNREINQTLDLLKKDEE